MFQLLNSYRVESWTNELSLTDTSIHNWPAPYYLFSLKKSSDSIHFFVQDECDSLHRYVSSLKALRVSWTNEFSYHAAAGYDHTIRCASCFSPRWNCSWFADYLPPLGSGRLSLAYALERYNIPSRRLIGYVSHQTNASSPLRGARTCTSMISGLPTRIQS